MSHTSAVSPTPLLPSFRRQQLLLEFASLKHRCPEGIYLTPNPNDPACWTGVYFVREGISIVAGTEQWPLINREIDANGDSGPYSSAALRFEILFPPSYPEAPPLVIFATEIFHPLLIPLTTYTFSPGALDPTATYSASETERLPPGAFSLRYGFPHWFSVAERGRAGVRSGDGKDKHDPAQSEEPTEIDEARFNGHAPEPVKEVPITIKILQYIKSAFEDAKVLDELPLEAAGSPNAWHAWRSHRGLPKQRARAESPSVAASARAGASPRNPADWNWDGVWEARVRNGIEESVSDALLFGSKNTRGGPSLTEQIRFAKLDDEKLASIQDDMLRMHRSLLRHHTG